MRLTKRGIAALDIGILRCDDHDVMNAIAQEITPAYALLRIWLARLPHPVTACGCSCLASAEFALTCVFDRLGRVFFLKMQRMMAIMTRGNYAHLGKAIEFERFA